MKFKDLKPMFGVFGASGDVGRSLRIQQVIRGQVASELNPVIKALKDVGEDRGALESKEPLTTMYMTCAEKLQVAVMNVDTAVSQGKSLPHETLEAAHILYNWCKKLNNEAYEAFASGLEWDEATIGRPRKDFEEVLEKAMARLPVELTVGREKVATVSKENQQVAADAFEPFPDQV